MEALRTALTSIAPFANYILIGLMVLALLLVLLLVVLALRARRRAKLKAQREAAQAAVAQQQAQMQQGGAPPEPQAQDGVPVGALPEEPEPEGSRLFSGLRAPGGLRRSFSRAIRLLRHNVAGRDYRYQTPWFLLLGQQGSGKSTLMRNSGLNLPLGRPEADARGRAASCNWWFFDNGVVLDVDGRYALSTTGDGSDERGWYGLLRLLQWYRPRRPLDGIILTIPASDLVGPDALSRHRLEATATALYHKLWEAQKRLGLRLPVYVVITKCDAIEGFGTLAGELPPALREQIFGWSSPYALGAAYAPQWLDEAGAAIDRDMLRLEAEVMARGRRVDGADGILMLHSRFGEIAGPLRLYIDELFKETAYHESFVFRGLYFTGDTLSPSDRANVVSGPESWDAAAQARVDQPMPGAAPAGRDGAGNEPAPVFVRHLLERKVFPELGLARPTSRRLASQNRVVRIAQGALAATMLLGAVGLAFAYNSISDSAGRMKPFVDATFTDLSDLERQRREVAERQEEIDLTIAAMQEAGVTPDELPQRPHLAIDKDFFTKSSQRLLQGSADIQDQELSSWLVPTSWFSDLDAHVRRTLGLAYERIILRSMLVQLNQKATQLMSPAASAPETFATDRVLRFAMEAPPFVQMTEFVDDVGELESNVRYYNGLRDGSTVERIDDLALFSFGITLPQVFEDKAHEFKVGTGEGGFQPFNVTHYRREAQRRVLRLDDATGEWLFEDNLLADMLTTLKSDLDNLRALQEGLGRGRPSSITLDDQVAALRALKDLIARTRSALSRPELAWLAHNRFNLGPDHQRLMTQISTSAFFGENVRKEISRRNEDQFKRLKAQLMAFSSPLTGPLLSDSTGQPQLRLSPSVLAIEKALDSFLGQSFLATTASGSFSKTIPSGRRLAWDNGMLEETLRVGEAFDLFLNFEIKDYPDNLQNGLAAIAYARLEDHMTSLIGQAQIFTRTETIGAGGLGEERLATDIRGFEGSSELLLRLHETLDRLRLTRVSGDFRRLVLDQSLSLLSAVDALLKADGTYLPNGQIGSWAGTEPISFQLYGVQDRTELGAYLALQRTRMEFLGYELARPLVDFLGQRRYQTAAGDLATLFRWQRILVQLDGYQKARAGNSIGVLEDFVINQLGDVRGDNCLSVLAVSKEKSGDFFLQRRRDIAQQVLSRCSGLTGQVVRRLYRELEGEFNQQLAGRFPFIEGIPKPAIPDASITEVRSFFNLYDRTMASDPMFAKKVVELFGAKARAAEFLARLAEVRTFFAPWLDQPANKGGPFYDYEVFFRVARDGENGGNQIIDWRLRTGGSEHSQLDEERKGRWNAGEPVSLSLRWATGSGYAPVQDGRRDDFAVTGKLARFSYEGNWSLLRLIASNRLNDKSFRTGGDVDPHTLALRIPLRPASRETSGQSGVIEPAMVFVRLRLSLPPEARTEGAAETLRMPVFPDRAPDLVIAANEPRPKR